MNSIADSLPLLYLAAAIGGIGAGAVYGTCVGNALKWFPDRRGLAAGLTAAGFGAGSALTVMPIANMIQRTRLRGRLFLVRPRPGHRRRAGLAACCARPPPAKLPRRRDGRAADAARLHAGRSAADAAFWVMYVMFVMVAAGGLMATAQLAPDRQGLQSRRRPGLDPRADAAGAHFRAVHRPRAQRPDAGRSLAGCPTISAARTRCSSPSCWRASASSRSACWRPIRSVFVLLSGWSSSPGARSIRLFPATCTDIYGRKFATTNYGMLYTAKGTAALLVPLANVLYTRPASWNAVFIVAAVLNIIAAVWRSSCCGRCDQAMARSYVELARLERRCAGARFSSAARGSSRARQRAGIARLQPSGILYTSHESMPVAPAMPPNRAAPPVPGVR